MKKIFILALLLGLAALPVDAQQPNAQQASDQAISRNWEQLTPAQRDALIAPLRDRWNNAPEEREKMLERARRWQDMPPELRTMAHHGMKRWEDMDTATRVQMREMFKRTRGLPKQQQREAIALFYAMQSMTPKQQQTLKQEWGRMSPEQRTAWMREHAPKRHRHRHKHHR